TRTASVVSCVAGETWKCAAASRRIARLDHKGRTRSTANASAVSCGYAPAWPCAAWHAAPLHQLHCPVLPGGGASRTVPAANNENNADFERSRIEVRCGEGKADEASRIRI